MGQRAGTCHLNRCGLFFPQGWPNCPFPSSTSEQTLPSHPCPHAALSWHFPQEVHHRESQGRSSEQRASKSQVTQQQAGGCPPCPELPLGEMGQRATLPAWALGLRKSRSSVLTRQSVGHTRGPSPPAEGQKPRGGKPHTTSRPHHPIIAKATTVHITANVVPVTCMALTPASANGQE